jgi:hypothetical protein
MPRIRVPIANFQFGEISPSLTSRTDTKIYTILQRRLRTSFCEMKVVYLNALALSVCMSLTL